MASTTPKTIPYQRLDPSHAQIRVIHMSPPTDAIESPIAVTLHTVSLDDPNLNYCALSYVWGNASNTVTITVDGAPFEATASLVAALRILRTTFAADPSRALWVDAVCINQADTGERTSQVKLMGRIYRQTSKVLVCLGPRDDHVRAIFAFLRVRSKTLQIWVANIGSSDAGLWLLAELDKVMHKALDTYGLSCASSKDTRVVPIGTSTELGENGKDPIDTFIDISVNRRYWSRMWAFQELQLPEDGIFIDGNDALVGLSEVKSVILWLETFESQLIIQGQPEQFSANVWREMVAVLKSLPFVKQLGLETQIRDSNSRATANDPATVDLLLRVTQFREATNPRDLYYGLLGVVGLPGLTIDYAASVEKVLTEASEALCNGGGEMLTYVLCYAGTATPRRNSFASLPSWVTTRGTIESMFLYETFWIKSHAGCEKESRSSYTKPDDLG